MRNKQRERNHKGKRITKEKESQELQRKKGLLRKRDSKGNARKGESQGKGSALTNAKGMVIIIIYHEIRILAETKKTGFFPNC